jgi:hypothetical protein
MAFIGTPLDTRNTFQSLQGKRFNGDGSTTAFTLDVAPSSTLDIEVFVGNVRQDPNSAYTLSGTTLTFTGAPPSGTNNIYVVHQAKSVGTIDPPATISTAQTFSSTVTMSGATTVSGALTASGGATISGTTPTLTIGDAGAEDAKIVFDGNAQDYHIGLDDSADDLVIGLGSSLGTTTHMAFDETGAITKPLQPAFMATGHDSTGALSNIATNNSQSDIPFPTEVFDQNGDYNNSNYTFTAPVTGRYLFCYNVLLTSVDSAATYVALRYISSNRSLDINILEPDFNADLGRYTLTGSIIGDLDASDTAKLTIAQYEGTAQMDVGNAGMHFSGCLLA